MKYDNKRRIILINDRYHFATSFARISALRRLAVDCMTQFVEREILAIILDALHLAKHNTAVVSFAVDVIDLGRE